MFSNKASHFFISVIIKNQISYDLADRVFKKVKKIRFKFKN